MEQKTFSGELSPKQKLEKLIKQNGGAFSDQLPKLEELLERYTAKPISIADDAPEEVKAMRQEAGKNPLKIIESLMASKETIESLQKPYDEAIESLAVANEIDSENIEPENLARAVEDASISREKEKIQEHIKNGGKVAVIVLGIGGTGKGTIIEQAEFDRAVNHTTRARRPGETEGVDYLYREDFGMDTPINEVEEKIDSEVLADLVRPGRGRYITSKKAIEEALQTSNVVFIEQSPEKVKEIATRAKDIMPDLLVLPICVLPPGRGVIELATRVAVRSYGDENHRDLNAPDNVYKLKDSYLTSTIGPEQINEILDTKEFLEGADATGIVYIVNDDLNRAVNTVNDLFKI